MDLEKQVVSLELAKKLSELGVKQESQFYWYEGYNGWLLHYVSYKQKLFIEYNSPYYSAFTSAELGEMLPSEVEGCKIKTQKNDEEYLVYIDYLSAVIIFFSHNEADARAKMLIYLIENNLMPMEK